MIYNLNQMIVGFLIFQRIGGKRKRPFLPRAWFMTIFICFFMSSNWRMSWLTSCTVVPLPAAMRRRRLALRI